MNKAKAYREIQKKQGRKLLYEPITSECTVIAVTSDVVKERLIEMLKHAANVSGKNDMEIFGVKRYQPIHSLNSSKKVPYPPAGKSWSQPVEQRASTTAFPRRVSWQSSRPTSVQGGMTLQSRLDSIILPSQYRRRPNGGDSPGFRGKKLIVGRTEPLLNVKSQERLSAPEKRLVPPIEDAQVRFPVASKIRQVLFEIPKEEPTARSPIRRVTPPSTNSSSAKVLRPCHPPQTSRLNAEGPSISTILLPAPLPKKDTASRQASFTDVDALKRSAGISLEQPLALTSKNVEMFTNMMMSQELRMPASESEDRVAKWVQDRQLMVNMGCPDIPELDEGTEEKEKVLKSLVQKLESSETSDSEGSLPGKLG